MDIEKAGLFVKVNIAAQRARQIMQGARPKIQTQSRKPAAIAIQEVEQGLIEAYTPDELPDPQEIFEDEPEEEAAEI